MRRVIQSEAALLFATAAMATLIFAWLMDLGHATWSVPLEYGLSGDHWITYFWSQSIFDFGSVYTNPQLNFPSGYAGYDFPVTEVVQLFVLRCCAALSGSSGAGINLYTLVNYPSIAVAAAAVMRTMGMRRGTALIFALLYTFLPYHFLRQQAHVFIAVYFFVPPTILMLWWLARGQQLTGPGRRLNRRGWAAIGVAAIGGLCGVYHVAFSLGFMLLVCVLRLARRLAWKELLAPILLAALMGGFCAATLVPTLMYQYRQGPNPYVAQRSPEMADKYGLRLAELILPQITHRISWLAGLHASYANVFGQWEEGRYSSLGAVGVVGLALMCWHCLRAILRQPHDRRLALAMIFVAAALCVASAGTIGSLVALFVTPAIRSLNRVSLFIAFFCLVAAGLRLDRWLAVRSVREPMKIILILTGILLIGLFDQTSPLWTPDHMQRLRDWNSDDAMIRQIERTVGPTAAIFNLPALSMPEGMVDGFSVQQPVLGYLHSQTLHWSHGFITGRPGASTVGALFERPPNDLPRQLRERGFAGILIDLRGFDHPQTTALLIAGAPLHFYSSDGHLLFIDVRRPAPGASRGG